MKAPAFQFYPKQWLGDDKILLMSWDARAMHMHLMCVAWQQDPPCTLPNDDELIRQWVGNPKDWQRLKTQIFRAWRLEGDRWIQSGLLAEFNKQAAYRESRKAGADAKWKKNAHASGMHCITDALLSSTSSSTSDKEQTPKSPFGDERKQPSTISQEFEEDWPKFWARVAKGDASKAYEKARKLVDRETLMRAVVEQGPILVRDAANQGRGVLHPATWLNGKRWEDEAQTAVATINSRARGQPIDRKAKAQMEFLERAVREQQRGLNG